MPNTAILLRYDDAGYIRPATSEEASQSIQQAQIDGGAGAITVEIDGQNVTCYVVGEPES